MPPLPKKRKSKEADVTPYVLAWFERNYNHSCALEIKVNKNKVLPHQQAALEQVAEGTFSYKIPDKKNGRNPFDGFVLYKADACIVRCEGRTCEVEVLNKNKKFTIHV